MEKIKTIAIIILLLLLIGGGTYFNYRLNAVTTEKEQNEKLTAALTDSLRVKKLENGQLQYEKLAMQADIKTLESGKITLTAEKKELISQVKKLNKEKDIFAATVVKQTVKIDSLAKIASTQGDFIDSTTVVFEKSGNDTINYKIEVTDVSKIQGKTPNLSIESLEIPNTATVAFGWDKDKRKDFPVSVSIINSNPLFKTNNVEAFSIPEIDKTQLKPTLWQKIKNSTKTTGGKIAIFGAGVLIGGLLIQ